MGSKKCQVLFDKDLDKIELDVEIDISRVSLQKMVCGFFSGD